MTIQMPKPYTNPAVKLAGCAECGKGGAPLATIDLGKCDLLTDYMHAECTEAVKARHTAWCASVEGRVAAAQAAGMIPCNHCGTTQDVHLMEADGNRGHLCIACGTKVERRGIAVRLVPTAEQVAELARWAAQGIGAN